MTLRADFSGCSLFDSGLWPWNKGPCAVPLQAAPNELFPVISAWKFANSCVLRKILLASRHGRETEVRGGWMSDQSGALLLPLP